MLDRTIQKIESRIPALETSLQAVVRCETGPDVETTLNDVIDMSYSSIRPDQALVAYEAVSSNARFQEVMSADFRRVLNLYHSQFVSAYAWLRRNSDTIDPAASFERSEVTSILETDDDTNAYGRFKLRLGAPFPLACTDRSFVRDVWNFHAIHAVNLRMSKQMQVRRQQFDEALGEEIARIEQRVGKGP